MERKFKELKEWLAQTFETRGVSYADINDFLECQQHRYHNRMVLFRAFSAEDIGKSNAKAMRYFNKWRKSH